MLSARPGVCWRINWRISCDTEMLPPTTGSKDRLRRAKTIDLCQNPLTVCPAKSHLYPSDTPHRSRKNRNCHGHARFPNGKSMTTRLLSLRADLLPRARFMRVLQRLIQTCWLEAVHNLRRVTQNWRKGTNRPVHMTSCRRVERCRTLVFLVKQTQIYCRGSVY